jgi:ferredoxin
MPKITVKIDEATCITAANCVGIAPDLFQIGSETYAELLDRQGKVQGSEYTFDATSADIELLEEAVDSCPTKAISLTPEG